MIPIDFTGKVALVTGVGDNESFAWFISKALQAAGAKIVLACHPRVVGIVESILTRDADRESRMLPYGRGELKVEKVLPCDASYDTMDDVPEEVRTDRRYAKFPEYSIQGTVDAVGKEFGGIDILIHSIAFSREITKPPDRHQPQGVLRGAGHLGVLADEPAAGGGAVHGRPAGRGERGRADVPRRRAGGAVLRRRHEHGQGGAADRRQAAGVATSAPKNIRVNLISAGPYASRAARSIRPGEFEKSIEYAAAQSPLPRPIKPEEVANATVFLCSPLASAVTGQILYVDCGYNVMAV